MKQQTASASYCTFSQILPHYAINGAGRLLGGYMLNIIDEAAAVSARRFCGCAVTTKLIDQADFIAPAHLGELFTVSAAVTRAGKTSVEVSVTGYAEAEDGARRLVCRAYVIVVAIDENGRPRAVPELICETDAEREELARAEERDAIRKARRAKNI